MREYLDIYTKKFDVYVYFKMWLFIELRQLLLRVFIYVDLSKRTFSKNLSQTFPKFRHEAAEPLVTGCFLGGMATNH